MSVTVYAGEWTRNENGELITKEYPSQEFPNEDMARKWLVTLGLRWLRRIGVDEDSHGRKMKLHMEDNRVDFGTVSEGYYQRYDKPRHGSRKEKNENA